MRKQQKTELNWNLGMGHKSLHDMKFNCNDEIIYILCMRMTSVHKERSLTLAMEHISDYSSKDRQGSSVFYDSVYAKATRSPYTLSENWNLYYVYGS